MSSFSLCGAQQCLAASKQPEEIAQQLKPLFTHIQSMGYEVQIEPASSYKNRFYSEEKANRCHFQVKMQLNYGQKGVLCIYIDSGKPIKDLCRDIEVALAITEAKSKNFIGDERHKVIGSFYSDCRVVVHLDKVPATIDYPESDFFYDFERHTLNIQKFNAVFKAIFQNYKTPQFVGPIYSPNVIYNGIDFKRQSDEEKKLRTLTGSLELLNCCSKMQLSADQKQLVLGLSFMGESFEYLYRIDEYDDVDHLGKMIEVDIACGFALSTTDLRRMETALSGQSLLCTRQDGTYVYIQMGLAYDFKSHALLLGKIQKHTHAKETKDTALSGYIYNASQIHGRFWISKRSKKARANNQMTTGVNITREALCHSQVKLGASTNACGKQKAGKNRSGKHASAALDHFALRVLNTRAHKPPSEEIGNSSLVLNLAPLQTFSDHTSIDLEGASGMEDLGNLDQDLQGITESSNASTAFQLTAKDGIEILNTIENISAVCESIPSQEGVPDTLELPSSHLPEGFFKHDVIMDITLQ